MPRKNSVSKVIPDVVQRGRWSFLASDASASSVGEWDVKEADLWSALRCVLSTGCAVRLGVTSDGGAVSLTIYDGDTLPTRKYVSNSIEFDDLMADLIRAGQRMRAGTFGEGPYVLGSETPGVQLREAD